MPANAFATKDGLTALITLVQGLSTIEGTVNRGVPEAFETRVSAYVAVGLPTITRSAVRGLVNMNAVYFVGFGYAIENAEHLAENKLADTLDEFVRAIEVDPSVGGAFGQIIWASSSLSAPEYATSVGQEFRHIRFALEAQMRENVLEA